MVLTIWHFQPVKFIQITMCLPGRGWSSLCLTLCTIKSCASFLFSSVLLWEVNSRARRGETETAFPVYWNRLKPVQFFTSGVAQISLCGIYMSHLNISRWNNSTFRLYFHFFLLFSSVLNAGTLLIPLFLIFVKRHTTLRYWCSLSKILLKHFQSHFSSSLSLLTFLFMCK